MIKWQRFSFDMFNMKIIWSLYNQNMKDCLENISQKWTPYQNADFFNQLHLLTDIIHKQQNTGKTAAILYG